MSHDRSFRLVRPARVLRFSFVGLLLVAPAGLVGCAAGAEHGRPRLTSTAPGLDPASAPGGSASATPAIVAGPASSVPPPAAPTADQLLPDLPWLPTRGDGPLCTAQLRDTRRRLGAMSRVFGAAAVEEGFDEARAREEAFVCFEDASRAWSVSPLGLDDEEQPPCPIPPENLGAGYCRSLAWQAQTAAIRFVEAGRESKACWDGARAVLMPCDAPRGSARMNPRGVGSLFHSWNTNDGFEEHVEMADVDADGRPELVFHYPDHNAIDPHSWYVALRAAGPGLPIEQHPAFLRPSVVGFVDVNGDGRRDLLTRASTIRCTDDVDPRHPDRSICHGTNAPLRCRLLIGRGFGAPGPCPWAPDAERNDPNRGWAVDATGR